MNIKIEKAEYIKDLLIKFTFSDNSLKIVDFKRFFKRHTHPQYNKYQKDSYFKDFKIINKDVIIWGNNWDLCFDVMNLYFNDLEKNFDSFEKAKDEIILN